MDRITSSLLSEFSADFGIDSLPEDKKFENFAAYLSTFRFVGESFEPTDIVLGSGGDTGIDAIAIIVNGVLITDSEAVSELAQMNGYIDATFVFAQAERSSNFSMQKIGQFGFGVEDFFRDQPNIPQNAEVKAASEIMTAIYKHSSKFKRGNPSCVMYYVTTGKWVEDSNLVARINGVKAALEQLEIFDLVEFTPLGASELQALYSQSKNAIARDFTFAERTLIPDIPGVKEAYLGYLPVKEFIPLLDDGHGEIMRGIFYDNVRDWQDYNAVNSEIKATLENEDQRTRFALMNNGVTIIARRLSTTGNKFHIEDYQVVNGCQTSHVLFDNQTLLDDSMVVPLRLIATDNEDITSSIVKATNRQTEVRQEQLLALSDFQKKLELFFASFPAAQRLYYERRSRQYSASAGNVEKTRIITPSALIRAYASMFMNEPHRTTRSYRALQQQLGKTIFGTSDRLEPYFLAASSHYRIEYLFRNGQLDAKYKPARYHILMAARLLMQPDPVPAANSNAMEKYCEDPISVIWDTVLSEDLVKQAAAIVATAAANNFDRDHIRQQPFTEEVKRLAVLARTKKTATKSQTKSKHPRKEMATRRSYK